MIAMAYLHNTKPQGTNNNILVHRILLIILGMVTHLVMAAMVLLVATTHLQETNTSILIIQESTAATIQETFKAILLDLILAGVYLILRQDAGPLILQDLCPIIHKAFLTNIRLTILVTILIMRGITHNHLKLTIVDFHRLTLLILKANITITGDLIMTDPKCKMASMDRLVKEWTCIKTVTCNLNTMRMTMPKENFETSNYL